VLDQNVQQENGLTPTGKGLDLSFLGKPHEHDPRRVYSTTATDWQARVDFDRLRKDRLARARMKMEEHDLGALVCFVGENVRYITSVFQGNWKNNIFIRYCVLPRDGDPVLFETAGSDFECAKIDAPWLNGNIRPAITWKWSETAEQFMVGKMAKSVHDVLVENGVENEKIGIDVYDPGAAEAFQALGLNTVSAWPTMSGARVVKTPDELDRMHDRRRMIGWPFVLTSKGLATAKPLAPIAPVAPVRRTLLCSSSTLTSARGGPGRSRSNTGSGGRRAPTGGSGPRAARAAVQPAR
jgi:hypothetical protein